MSSSLVKLYALFVLSAFLIVPAHFTDDDPQLTPDDEDSEEYNTFLSELEDRTGLSNQTPNYTIDGITYCDGKVVKCTVNPHGDVIWDVRYALYEAHMLQANDDPTIPSIDGCLRDNSDSAANNATYNECMRKVRTKMIAYLHDEFEKLFISTINENCSLIDENCM